MTIFDTIALFLNNILAALQGIAKLGQVASNPLGGIFGTQSTGSEENAVKTEQGTKGNEILPEQSETPQNAPKVGKRYPITIPETINARFNDTGSPAWANQPGGRHLGTDFGAPNGSPVFAPYDMRIVKIGSYTDEGRRGDYIISTLSDGTEYYTGHLTGVLVASGEYIKGGTKIASIGYYNHTHIQLRVNGALTDFEVYEKTH